jgi:coenzyme F420-reducing hydrogenase delta subunit
MDADRKATLHRIAPSAVPLRAKPPAAEGRGVVVAYICENAGRPGRLSSSGIRQRPSLPDFAWPLPVRQVAVPCAGRLQPEHFLKALEDGADAVGVICCDEGNCHHLEGNRRCRRRLDYVGRLVEQAGLERDRLMIFHLPGSAAEDMALGAGGTPATSDLIESIAGVRAAFLARLATLSRNPLGKGDLPDLAPYDVDTQDASDE